jgi:hypothetical protein
MRTLIGLSVALCVLVAAGACGTSSSNNAPDASMSGSSSGTANDGAPGDGSSGMPIVVPTFSKTLFAFGSTTPGGARRQTTQTTFPTGTFSNITLELHLDCPTTTGGCDHWDRVGSLGLVTEPAVDGGSHGAVVELARFVTPFAVAAGPWQYDVTDLAPLLSGAATVEGFIDTWSPQGSPGANGAGWLVTATFTFTPGTPAKTPVANIPLWTWPADSDPPSIPYGDSTKPISAYLTPQTVMLPAGATSYALRSFVTGHGQGNSDNCAEFCQATHRVTIGSAVFTDKPWRTCCTPDPACESQNNPMPAPGVTPGQFGTYMYPRSGWCPGSAVQEWTQDVSNAVMGSTATIGWEFDSYMNTCRDDFSDAGDAGACACDPASGSTCAYNGGSHTEPIFHISSVLVAYK